MKTFFKKITTTKLLIAFLFLNCTIIEIFTGFVTMSAIKLAYTTGITPDFSPLVCLIGAIVGEVIGYGIYSLKSLKENQKNGIVYEMAMKSKSEG